jgi:hypothetical protein
VSDGAIKRLRKHEAEPPVRFSRVAQRAAVRIGPWRDAAKALDMIGQLKGYRPP